MFYSEFHSIGYNPSLDGRLLFDTESQTHAEPVFPFAPYSLTTSSLPVPQSGLINDDNHPTAYSSIPEEDEVPPYFPYYTPNFPSTFAQAGIDLVNPDVHQTSLTPVSSAETDPAPHGSGLSGNYVCI
jgi:hypothetical protein